MPEFPNRQKGHKAVEIVADEFGLDVDTESAYWFDAVLPTTGTKYEVKSTSVEIGDEYREEGRFRLWADQHKRLLEADRNGTAWYAFVLFDGAGRVENIQRRRPTTVSKIVDHWNTSKHKKRRSKQHKVPWSEIMSK